MDHLLERIKHAIMEEFYFLSSALFAEVGSQIPFDGDFCAHFMHLLVSFPSKYLHDYSDPQLIEFVEVMS